MVRHALAPILPAAARWLALPRTLGELRAVASHGPGAGVPPGLGRDSATGAVAITFDDGPHPEGTPAILEILARHAAVATFFVVGEQVERRPELVRAIEAAGHHVALHGYRHRLQLRRARGEMHLDIERGAELLARTLGHPPVLHRAPYGIYSPAGIEAAHRNGLQPLLWSRWGRDWRAHITPASIARRVTAGLKPGDVILLHDADFYSAPGSHRRTAQALELILRQLHARGLGTVLAV